MPDRNLLKQILEATRETWDRLERAQRSARILLPF